MANEAYISGFNFDSMMVPTKAATVFAAQESSLYLSGQIVPMVNVPAGSVSAQVPLMGTVDADAITSEAGTGADFEAEFPSDTSVPVNLQLLASRSVVRDFGGVDTSDVGRILGNAIGAKVDALVSTELGDLTQQEIPTTGGTLSIDEIYKAVGAIRGAGEQGQLFGIVSASAYAELMANIGTQAYAGGDFQTEALRNGFLGTIAGVQTFVSSALNDTNSGLTDVKMAVFSRDAIRGAIQGGVNLEVARRAAAVGVDVVASLGFGCAEVDATRGRIIIDAA